MGRTKQKKYQKNIYYLRSYDKFYILITLLIKIYFIQCKDKKTYQANLYLKSSTSYFFLFCEK